MAVDPLPLAAILTTVALGALLAAGALPVLMPWLARHAMDRPNARSMHTVPVPRGGGLAVIGATILAVSAMLLTGLAGDLAAWRIALALAAAAGIAAVGAVDDMAPMPVAPRLAFQFLAAAVILAAIPAEARIWTALPWWLERALLLVASVWFVNLTNFMDGMDWMTVAETAPVAAMLIALNALNALAAEAALVAAALLGAILGFAPYNRPLARVFLGDVGSLPIGLLLAWMLVWLATEHIAAALLLPMYYLADATTTLLRRLLNGEPIHFAHRSHFYQRAAAAGLAPLQVTGRVFGLNMVLAALALLAVLADTPAMDAACLAVGLVTTALVLWSFEKGWR